MGKQLTIPEHRPMPRAEKITYVVGILVIGILTGGMLQRSFFGPMSVTNPFPEFRGEPNGTPTGGITWQCWDNQRLKQNFENTHGVGYNGPNHPEMSFKYCMVWNNYPEHYGDDVEQRIEFSQECYIISGTDTPVCFDPLVLSTGVAKKEKTQTAFIGYTLNLSNNGSFFNATNVSLFDKPTNNTKGWCADGITVNDPAASIREECDTIDYHNGTKIKVNCMGYDDLVMHFKCVPLPPNATVEKRKSVYS